MWHMCVYRGVLETCTMLGILLALHRQVRRQHADALSDSPMFCRYARLPRSFEEDIDLFKDVDEVSQCSTALSLTASLLAVTAQGNTCLHFYVKNNVVSTARCA